MRIKSVRSAQPRGHIRPVLPDLRPTLPRDSALVAALLVISLVSPLMACSQAGLADEIITTALPPSPTPQAISLAHTAASTTPPPETLTPPPTPLLTTTLVVWWPEPLAPYTRPDLLLDSGALAQQINAFDLAEGVTVDVDFRLKAPQDVGGIMSTLRTASVVAQGALPDVTLLRREDLLTAVQLGLVYPLEDMLSPAMVGDLYPIGLELGRVNGELYGLAYTLDVIHLAYLDDATPPEGRWTFAALLDQQQPLVFPATRANGVNNTFLIQYLAAGGVWPGASEQVDPDALETVLGFYEQAVARAVIPASVLEYQSTLDYMPALERAELPLAVVTSNQYLQLRAEGVPLEAAPIPTSSGESLTIANSWMWVITAPTADRQAVAARFINWMMDMDRQRQYLEAVYFLPSQEIALRGYDRTQVDPILMEALFQNAVLPLSDTAGGTGARAMQSAVIAVLNREQSASEAVEDILALSQQP